jgi:4-hydroxybenzoyl-CoA thioesterase
MVFSIQQKILFKHCDPAGIVFYPRYFEMINDCVEAFFDSQINWPFEEIHKTNGIPTVAISSHFKSPSRHGDYLQLNFEVNKLGRSSLHYTITAECNSELRFKTECTLVNIDSKGKSTPWTQKIRGKLEQFMEGQI